MCAHSVIVDICVRFVFGLVCLNIYLCNESELGTWWAIHYLLSTFSVLDATYLQVQWASGDLISRVDTQLNTGKYTRKLEESIRFP